MSSEIKIKMDSGSLIKSADGKVTLGGNGSCVTWALFVFSVVSTIGAIAVTVSIIPRFFDSNFLAALGNILVMVGITAFLGFAATYLFNNAKRGKVTIDPATKLIKIGKRDISFAEVDQVFPMGGEVPFISGAVAIKFLIVLKTGEQVNIGSISGDSKKIDELVTQILTILGETITK